MQLKDLLQGITLPPSNIANQEVAGIATDSRQVKQNYAFIAVVGFGKKQGEAGVDGHQFVSKARENGATVIIVNRASELTGDDIVTVEDTRNASSIIASNFYHHPEKKLKIIGITGTNGKTTTSYLIEAILKKVDPYCGRIGTIDYSDGVKTYPAPNTTPGPLDLAIMFSRMVKNGSKHVVMEVSSHALEQGRVEGIEFSTAIFTNLTQDHLDYHETFDQYLESKTLLFKKISRNGTAVLNADDGSSEHISKETNAKTIYFYSQNPKKKANIQAKNVKMDFKGSELDLITPKGNTPLKTNLIGRHNISNILAAVGCVIAEGIPLKHIIEAIQGIQGVSGRLEEATPPDHPFKVFVDYAHTPDALKNVLSLLREIATNRIITVFGCGGDRDKTKRPKMGRISVEFSDITIITSDNPRSEIPEDIISEIEGGAESVEDGGTYEVEVDRREAIGKAISMAEPEDIVLIAGKGHEKYQIFRDGAVDFEDIKVAQKYLS